MSITINYSLYVSYSSLPNMGTGCYSYLPSSGASSGILLLRDKRVVEKIEVYVGEYVVACSFRNIADYFTWAFVGVWSMVQISTVVKGLFGRSWLDFLIGGICLSGSRATSMSPLSLRKTREACFCPAMMEFSDFISELGLMDLPLSRVLSMWFNNSSWSRLDRFLVSPDWETNYPRLLQKRVPRLCSDHFSYSPLLRWYSRGQKNLLNLRICG
jgi:hypothetical protein